MPEDEKPKKGRNLDGKDKVKKIESHDELRKRRVVRSTEEAMKQIATRAKLERDFKEDTLYITFNTSPETERTLLARRPTHSEMVTILKLSSEASKYEGRVDAESDKMVDIYNQLPELAARLSVDTTLDEEFWKDFVSFSTLQNFITQLIIETQRGTGPGGMTPDEIDTFRDE